MEIGSEQGVYEHIRQCNSLTWENESGLPPRSIFICASPGSVPMFCPFPSPPSCRRGCTVPGEGWSPAETEHSGEAPRRRCSPLRRRVRGTSPLVAARIGARGTRDDRDEGGGVPRRLQRSVVVQRSVALAT